MMMRGGTVSKVASESFARRRFNARESEDKPDRRGYTGRLAMFEEPLDRAAHSFASDLCPVSLLV
jgi:hypothetical protein